ncbi:MAG TPA: GAF domain-containing protein [Thermoleophilia bacterium]|nr:GAF domain-containing protein [Thermoleophilia bacterium]
MRIGRANGDDWLRLGEAAAELGVSLNTLRRWSDAGKLTCYRSPGGHRRYRRAHVEALLHAENSGGAIPCIPAGPADVAANAFGADDPRAPLLALARVAAEGVGVTGCRISLRAEDGGLRVMSTRSRIGGAIEDAVAGAGDALPAVREVLRTGRRLVIADLATTSLLDRGDAAVHRQRGDAAILALPVNADGRIRAVMELVESRAPRTFDGANLTFAEFMARQASRLISTQEAEEEPGPTARLPDEAASTPGAPSFEAEELLRTLVERLRHETHAAACDILRYDPDADSLEPVAAAAAGEAASLQGLVYPSVDFGEAAGALTSGEPVMIRDLSGQRLAGPHLVRRDHNGAHSVYATAIHLGDRVVGLLEVYGTAPDLILGRDELAVVEAAAAAAALVLGGESGPGVLSRRVAELDGLIAGFSAFSPAMDPESFVLAALQALREREQIAACTLYRVDAGVAEPFPAGDTRGNPIDGGAPWRLEEYAAATAAESSGSPVTDGRGRGLEPDRVAAKRFLDDRGLTSVVLAPVVVSDRCVGVLELGAADADGLTTAEDVAQVTADLLAVVLGSSDVVARLQRRNRDLTLVLEAVLEGSARLTTDEVLHAVVERLAELTRTPVADIYSVEGDTLRALVSYDGGHFDVEWEGIVLPLRRYPCSLRAVETCEITIAPSLDDAILAGEGRRSLEKWGYQSQLSMPLMSGGHVLGVIELCDYQPRDFAEDLDLIRGLGQVAAHALENAALLEQVDRRTHVLNELVELGMLARHTRDAGSLTRTIAERVLATVDAASCDIYRMEDDALRCVASFDRSGHDESVLGSEFDLERYPTTVEAMDGHRALIISSPDDLQLNEDERRTYREYGFASEICLPLVVNDELFGLLDIYDTRERDFTEYLSFLSSVAQTIAGAFESALLVDQLERRGVVLREIVELGAVASQTHDLETVLTALAERLRDTIGAADCDIFTLQGDQLRCLVSADRDGLDASVVGHVLDIDLFPATAMAVRSGQVMAIASRDDPRLTEDERRDMAAHGFESELCIPLVGGDRVIGLIDVFDTRPRDYGEYLDFLRSVGQTAAGAIENAMLLDKLERRNTTLAELVELGRAASGAGGLSELVRAVAPRLVDVMEADGCQVFILRDETIFCVLTYDNGEFLEEYPDPPLDLDLFPSTRTAIAAKTALVIESPGDPRLSDYERDLYLKSGSQSEICVPLVLDDRVVGLLDVYDHRRRDYAEYRDFLLRVGQMMAGALENALLMERLEESNQTLGLLVESGIEFGATLDRDDVLESVARRLCAATAAPSCDIFTVHGDVMRCVACIDHGEPDPEYVGTEYPLAELGLARAALETRQPLYAEDIATDPRVSDFERSAAPAWGHRAMLHLPLISRGEVIGIAGIYDDHSRRFERLDFLHSLAQVAASALTNATLFDQLDRSAERMALVGDVSFELSSSLDLHEVLLSTARRLCAVAEAPTCDIYTLRDDAWLTSVASVDEGSVDAAWQDRSFPLDEWAAMRKAVETREPVVVENRDDPLLLPGEVALMAAFGESGALIVPLISKERVIGVLELTHREVQRRFSPEEIATVVSICRFAAIAIDNAELYEGIKRMHLGNLKALSSALNAKDYYTLGHAARVAAYMALLGKELGWSDALIRDVEEAAYLHDIGKIGVPDRVLLKPSGLNGHEWELMRQHPLFSADIIQPLFDDALVEGVRHHHERWAGDGYPAGLVGEAIPPIARAMCVADSYDAMSFRRPYRQGYTDEECLDELERCRGIQFDPGVVDAFRRVLERVGKGRRSAAGVAGEAAAVITAAECLALREDPDDSRPEFAALAQKLRAASAAGPRSCRVKAYYRDGRRAMVLADSQAGSPEAARPGDAVIADDELVEVFAGREPQANVLFVDQWGVWIRGVAAVLDAEGSVVAALSADVPATEGITELEGLRSNVALTFASMLQSTAVHSGRTELEAITDGLTGLYNHRYFHERLSEEMERCLEQDTSMALLFCDLDNFRAFNELHGHGSGDRALRAVARVLESSVRHVDLAARYGGQEFAAILIDTAEAGALEVAERVRAGIMRTQVAAGADTLSVSIGVATCPKDATFKDELIDKADWAMFLAKRRGRNKVMTFSGEHGGETPEQAAVVHPEHVAAMGELVAAREAFRQRRRSAVAQIALAVARANGVPPGEILTAVTAADAGESETGSPAGKIVALAQTYQAFVTERPYRARISEAEALDELLKCPALTGETRLARAFELVLAR